jgi:hypothetical protein
MTDIEMNLFLAIAAEHQSRTGHKALEANPLQRVMCDVCLYLNALDRARCKAEEEYYLKEALSKAEGKV